MRRLVKVMKIFFLSALGVLVLLVAIGLGLRARRQHALAETIAIHTPKGIDEARYFRIGGIDQWIQIRGEDRDNPVLLCLHGGPGGSWMGQTTVFLPWEKEFTVVQWDQRGTGKTLETTGSTIAATMSVDRMTEDGLEVAELLRKHLNKDRIALLGFSWGSLLGVRMARRRPDLFFAYVGTGQISDMPAAQRLSYAYALEKARSAGDARAVSRLEGIGPPPFDNMGKIVAFFEILKRYECVSDQNAGVGVLTAPNYSLRDIYYLFRGFAQVPTYQVYSEMLSAVPTSSDTTFEIPVFLFQGALDERTPATLARTYFDRINAPHKDFVLFEKAGHFVVLTEPDEFLHELVTRVRQKVTASGLSAPE